MTLKQYLARHFTGVGGLFASTNVPLRRRGERDHMQQGYLSDDRQVHDPQFHDRQVHSALATQSNGFESGRGVVGQQSVILALDHRIALTGAPLESATIEYGDVAAPVTDQSGHLQAPG